MRKLLYLDASFTFEELKLKGLDHVLAIRSLNGFFGEVWSAHPVDTQEGRTGDVQPWGKSIWHDLNPQHHFIRGRAGRFAILHRAKSLNALLALVAFTAQMVALVRKNGVDVVRAGDPLMTGLLGLIITRLTRAHLVVRINGNHDALRAEAGKCIQPSLFKWIRVEEAVERAVISRASSVLVPNADYESFAEAKGASPNSFTRTNYGNLIDPAHLTEPAAREPICYEDFFGSGPQLEWIGHIGRLHEVKRVEEAYDSFLRLSQHVDSCGLCFVGEGPLQEKIRDRAVSDGIKERILFLGDIDQKKLARGMPWFVAVVSPRTGRALAEAAFGARPIVAYDLDWQGELIESGKSGLLVPAGDTQGMAEALETILRDRGSAAKMGEAARRRAIEFLSPATQTAAEISAYKNVLEGRNER